MSLDINLMVTKPTSVWDYNITHNLGKMAAQVRLSNGHTLYQVLWRPEEIDIEYAGEIIRWLEEGLSMLLSDPEKYKEYNPENGWGSYEGLVQFVEEYIKACVANADAKIETCR